MATRFKNWLGKTIMGDPEYKGPTYTDPVPIDPGVFDYDSWKDRTLSNREHMGMIPSEVPLPATREDQWTYQGSGPGYQPLHERTKTMYVNPALAGTDAYESWYPKAGYDIETEELSGNLSEKEFFGYKKPLFPPQITNRYPLDPDYAALWAGDQYMERVGDEPAFYDATQMYTDELTADYIDWLESPERQEEEGSWRPLSTLGSYDPHQDRVKFNVGEIRGAGPEMIGGSGIDRFGHEQVQEWDSPGRDMNRPHWRNTMDEVTRHELKHSAEKEFGKIVPYPKEEAENPVSGRMENYPQLGWGDTALHREIYMGDPIWNKQHWAANPQVQGLPATWEESENVMAMHNWAKDQYLNPQHVERPNMRDVAGPTRNRTTFDRQTFDAPPSIYTAPPRKERVVRGGGPSRAQQRLNTGGLVSLVL